MAKNRQTMTISLPEAMLSEVQRVSREENRTHSELVREALRRYLRRGFPPPRRPRKNSPASQPDGQEVEKGDYVTLQQILHGQDAPNRKAGGKDARKTARS